MANVSRFELKVIMTVFITAIFILGSGLGFTAYQQDQRITVLEGQVNTLRSYSVPNLEKQVKDTPSQYQLAVVAQKVDDKADSSQLTTVRNTVETVQTRVNNVVRPWPFEENPVRGSLDSWNIFLSFERSALLARDNGDLATARFLALNAFNSIGVYCTPRQIDGYNVKDLAPVVDDYFSFVPVTDKAGWVYIYQKGGGC